MSKLKGLATWTYFYLYVILDVSSRYVVRSLGPPDQLLPDAPARLAAALIASSHLLERDGCRKLDRMQRSLAAQLRRVLCGTAATAATLAACATAGAAANSDVISFGRPAHGRQTLTVRFEVSGELQRVYATFRPVAPTAALRCPETLSRDTAGRLFVHKTTATSYRKSIRLPIRRRPYLVCTYHDPDATRDAARALNLGKVIGGAFRT